MITSEEKIFVEALKYKQGEVLQKDLEAAMLRFAKNKLLKVRGHDVNNLYYASVEGLKREREALELWMLQKSF